MQFRDPQLETSGRIIGFYPREFYFLDNFSAFQIEVDNIVFPTIEHAYHYYKFKDHDTRLAKSILTARSPHQAQKIAYANKDRQDPEWDNKKLELMEEFCRCKLNQHDYVKEKLLSTSRLEIVEDSTKDDFWGWGKNRAGRNELGKIWMKLRNELMNP
jgi:ribA/ribD-fused uncharacterized protein